MTSRTYVNIGKVIYLPNYRVEKGSCPSMNNIITAVSGILPEYSFLLKYHSQNYILSYIFEKTQVVDRANRMYSFKIPYYMRLKYQPGLTMDYE